MVIGIAVVELHIPEARSIKDKRRVVKSLVDRIHQRCRVSIAETDLHDLHQRVELGVAIVGRSDGEIQHLLDEVRRMTESDPQYLVTRFDSQLLEGI